MWTQEQVLTALLCLKQTPSSVIEYVQDIRERLGHTGYESFAEKFDVNF